MWCKPLPLVLCNLVSSYTKMVLITLLRTSKLITIDIVIDKFSSLKKSSSHLNITFIFHLKYIKLLSFYMANRLHCKWIRTTRFDLIYESQYIPVLYILLFFVSFLSLELLWYAGVCIHTSVELFAKN